MAMKIRKGDVVMVIAGDDKGKTGRVLAVDSEKQRVVVEKVNFVKRHTKARRQGGQSGIIEKEAPLHLSNVQLYDAEGRSRHARRRPGAAGRPPGAHLARERRDAVEGGLGDEDGERNAPGHGPGIPGSSGPCEPDPGENEAWRTRRSPRSSPGGEAGEGAEGRQARQGRRGGKGAKGAKAGTVEMGRPAGPVEKPRLAKHYEQTVRPGADGEVPVHQHHAGAAPGEDRAQHGRGRRAAGREAAGRRRERAVRHRGPAADGAPREEVDLELQAARGRAGRAAR